MPLSSVGHFSLSFPFHCTGINESWVKRGTQKNEGDRESEREMGGLGRWLFLKEAKKINTSRNVACHVWTKEEEEEKSSVATYLKINCWLYFSFSRDINNTPVTDLCVLLKRKKRRKMIW